MTDLSIATAQKMFAGRAEDVSELRGELADHHSDEPQKAMLADLALREVEVGLDKLRSLGHHFYLSRGDRPAPQEFPKMLYRADGSTLVVEDLRAESMAKDEGWGERQGAGGAKTSTPVDPTP